MKTLFAASLIVVLLAACALGQTQTPNLQLTQPYYNEFGWGDFLNNNWKILDSRVLYNCPLPSAQSCINALPNGGSVYLTPGTYAGPVTLPDNGTCVNLIGSGIDVTYIGVSALVAAVVSKGNLSLPFGCRISDLTIDGSLLATNGLQLLKGKGWKIEHVKVRRVLPVTGQGMDFGEAAGAPPEFYEARIRDVQIAFESGDYTAAQRPLNGIHLETSATDNQINDITAWNMSGAGVVDDGGDNQFDKVHVYGFPVLTYYPSYAIDILGNSHWTQLTADGVNTCGAHVRGNGNSITNATFQWPIPGQVSGAFPVCADAGADYNIFTNNTVRNGSGLQISGIAAVFAKFGTGSSAYQSPGNTEMAGNTNYGDGGDGQFLSYHISGGFNIYGTGTPIGGFTYVSPYTSQRTVGYRLLLSQTGDFFVCLGSNGVDRYCRMTLGGEGSFRGLNIVGYNLTMGTIAAPGDVVCVTANLTLSDCPHTGNPVPVGAAFDTNVAIPPDLVVGRDWRIQVSGLATLNLDGTYSPSSGWFACLSSSTNGQVTLQSSPCTAGRQVGVVAMGGTGLTTASVWLGLGSAAAISSTAGGDLSGTLPSPTVSGLEGVPFCTGFTPTNGQPLQYTTASSPNPCYTAGPSTVIYADNYGSNEAAIAAAIAAAPSAGATVVLGNVNYALPAVLTVSKPVVLKLGAGTLTCAMADPGTSSGCINVTSDGVVFDGAGQGVSVLTQANAANIQTLIYVGTHGNITWKNFTLNGNEANQTNTGLFYAGLRSTDGSHDLTVDHLEFTGAGTRAIDFRGTKHAVIQNNWFHQTGINIAGQGTAVGGNAISVDTDGGANPSSTDGWAVNNLCEEWGDACIALVHGARNHVIGNTMKGRLFFGHTPVSTEFGIDSTGSSDTEIIGNHVIDVLGFALDTESFAVAGTCYGSQKVRIIGNEFQHDTSATVDARVFIGDNLCSSQPQDIEVKGNNFNGVLLIAQSFNGLDISGNIWRNITTGAYTSAVNLYKGTYGVAQNFVVANNIFQTDDSSIATAIYVDSSVTAPGNSRIVPNDVMGSITPYSGTTAGLTGSAVQASVLELVGATSGIATITPPAAAGTTTNPIVVSNALQLPSVSFLDFSTDTGISRGGAGVFDFGNGTYGSQTGVLLAAGTNFGGNVDIQDQHTGITLQSNLPLGFSSTSSTSGSLDTGISRGAAGVIKVGNGTAGDASGSITAANFNGGINGAAVPASTLHAGINSSGQFVDARVGHISLASQGTGGISGAAFFTCGSAGGQYRVHIALYTMATGSSGTVQASISFNTGTAAATLYSGTAAFTSAGSAGQAVGTMPFHCGASQAVTYTTTVTCSSCGSPTYGIDLVAYRDQ